MDLKNWIDLALSCGFTASCPLDPSTIELKEEVRAMCLSLIHI